MSEWIVEITDGLPHTKQMKELVRCKDCVHCTDWHGSKPEFTCEIWFDESVFPNDFCSYAERRSE
jgi:hypothetical protein